MDVLSIFRGIQLLLMMIETSMHCHTYERRDISANPPMIYG